MRKIVLFIVFVVTVSLPLTSIAVSNVSIKNEGELRDECSYEITGMGECLQKKQKASEVDLKLAEEKVRKSLAKWHEDPKYIRIAQVRLAASVKAFIRYREEQCTFASSLGGGAIGYALNLRRSACIAELNNRRAEQLRNAVSDLPLK